MRGEKELASEKGRVSWEKEWEGVRETGRERER